MGKEWRAGFSTFSMFVLLAALLAVCSTAAKALPAVPSAVTQQTDETRSVSGTIASVGRNSFTLTLTSAFSRHGQQFQQNSPNTTPKAMTFLVDKNTTIDGKLRVGASADVTYRQSSGSNIAINVRVAS